MKKLILFGLLVVVLSSCYPIVQVRESVYVTVEPTATAYPTYTPYPTQTLIPTPTKTPRFDTFEDMIDYLESGAGKVTTAVRDVASPPDLIYLDQAGKTMKRNGFAYYDRWIDTTTDDHIYAYRYLSVGVFVTFWSDDDDALDRVTIIFLFDDTPQTRLNYAERGILALKNILPQSALNEVIRLNAEYNVSSHRDLEEYIKGTQYYVRFSRDSSLETCADGYICSVDVFPSITYTGTYRFIEYRIDLWLTG